MLLEAFPSGPFGTNAYVVACPETKEAAIVDPAPDSKEAVIKYLNNHDLTPTQLLITHSHWDHIADAAALKSELNIPLYIHELDTPNLINPGADHLPMMEYIPGTQPDGFLKDGDEIKIGNLKWSVIHTPGHSPGSICFYCKENNTLLTGDTLFKGSIGNLSFPTSQPHLMATSLEKLAQLPPETKIYPGHGSSSTIGKESWLPNAKKMFGL